MPRTLFILHDPPYGTCRDARGVTYGELAEAVHRSSPDQLMDGTRWADTIVVF